MQVAVIMAAAPVVADHLSVQPLDSPTDFMLFIAERSELGDKAGLLCDTIEALAQVEHRKRARKLCQEALKATDRIKQYNDVTSGGHYRYMDPLGRIAAVLARTGDASQALSIADRICGTDEGSGDFPHDKTDALCRIADGFTQAGDKSQARKICQLALKSADKEKAPALPPPKDREAELRNIFAAAEHAANKGWMLGRIAESLAKAGNAEQAKELCEQALISADQIMKPDRAILGVTASKKADALGRIAIGLAHVGDTQKARQVCQQALEAANLIDRSDDKSFRMRNVAEAMVRAGDFKHAREVCQQALNFAEGIGPGITARNWRSAAEVYEKEGDDKTARRLRQSAVSAEKMIDNHTISALCGVAEAFAKAEERPKAREICQQALSLAKQLIAGFPKPASKVGESIESALTRESISWSESYAFLHVAEAFRAAGDIQQAREVYKIALRAANQLDRASLKALILGRIGKALATEDGKMKPSFDPDDRPMAEAIVAAFPNR
jgi:tetratricopeptide (TPR) repeat protein